jgi:hypothetical protein
MNNSTDIMTLMREYIKMLVEISEKLK